MSKKAVFIIAQKDFRDEEILQPQNILIARGIETKVAAKTKNKAVGKLGTEIQPDLALAEVNEKDFDAIIFVGGPGATEYVDDETAWLLINNFKLGGKIIGAICLAPLILANAGVLISKTVTGTPSIEADLRNKGSEYTGMQVEVDGKIVTAKDPTAAKEFGEKLAYLLEE
ncbi:MAG: DJ-1/PfpI family protein [Candidatus Buchananbacteria bacterium]